MLLFVPSWSFEGYGEHPCDPSGLSHLLAGVIMIVSIGALTLTLCRALLMLLAGGPAESLGGFGPPPCQHITLSL
jgi:hypothetical protein